MMSQKSLNVGRAERLGSALMGSWLAARGLRHRSAAGMGLAGLGAFLLTRGLTGHCSVYQATHISTRKDEPVAPQLFSMSLHINRPSEEVAEAARQHLVEFMGFHTDARVMDIGGEPGFILEDGEGKATVRIVDAEGDHGGTTLTIVMAEPETDGKLRQTLDHWQIPGWDHRMRQGLRHFKSQVESGEVATTSGQTHGRRSAKGLRLLKIFKLFQEGPQERSHRQQMKASAKETRKVNQAHTRQRETSRSPTSQAAPSVSPGT